MAEMADTADVLPFMVGLRDKVADLESQLAARDAENAALKDKAATLERERDVLLGICADNHKLKDEFQKIFLKYHNKEYIRSFLDEGETSSTVAWAFEDYNFESEPKVEPKVEKCWTCGCVPAPNAVFRDALNEYEYTCDECHRNEYPEEYEDEEDEPEVEPKVESELKIGSSEDLMEYPLPAKEEA